MNCSRVGPWYQEARGEDEDEMRLSPVSPLHGRYDISDSYGT